MPDVSCKQTMDTLKVNIDAESGTITVWNNGGGIPVQMHNTEKCWLPELIFGHLLTSRLRVEFFPSVLIRMNPWTCTGAETTKQRRNSRSYILHPTPETLHTLPTLHLKL